MFYAAVLSFGLLLAPLARAAIHDVTVGSSTGSLTFSPEAISAAPGDQVVFTFQQKNHSATQSSFADPCGKAVGGFNSGFNPVMPNVTANFPTYTITVNDTTPIWVYCAQAAGTSASHCGQGMVFAVNCGADGSPNSFTNFKQAALAVGASLQASASAVSAAPSSSVTSSAPPAASAPASTLSVPPSTTASSSAAAATHTVIVGGNSSLTFSPDEVTAQPNDVVVFQFVSKNHTITQSSFAAPCQELGATSSTPGFDSGFMPVANGTTDFPTYSITVNSTAPVWAYCRQTGHCGLGMVFALNAQDNSTKSFSAFQASAKQINGTTSNSTSTGASSSPSPTSGAERTIGAVSMSLAVVGAVFLLL